MPQAVVLLSGGLDSSTLLYKMKADGHVVTALSVDYGQRHVRELASAEAIAHAADVPLVFIELGEALYPIFSQSKSSQVGGQDRSDVPEGHYAAENMKITIVPNRNMMLISIAGALAESIRKEDEKVVVAYAAHAGDHSVYFDCRPEFISAAARALSLATNNHVTLSDPFADITKADIVKRAEALQVPIGLTWSCYKGEALQCGRCSTCVERREACAIAGVTDPTVYADKTDFWKTVVPVS
jgi:7-cyano-7-deazaguanine synthase